VLVDRTLLFALLVVLPFEYGLALRPGRPAWRRWVVDIQLLLINGFVAKYPAALILAILLTGIGAVMPPAIPDAVGGQPVWLQALEILVVADLAVYASHRAFHHPLLWRFHAVHHSAEEMDWLVAYRNHPVEIIVLKVVTFLPVFALGFSSVAIGIYAVVFAVQAMFTHANTRVSLGPLRHVIVGPEFHHWHHADEPAAYDKNFSAVFSFWDRLFGTHYDAPARHPSRYGVVPKLPANAIGLLLHPFRNRRNAASAAPLAPAIEAGDPEPASP
jgi:sterol desaturase/sphingolipid hydroxylase (fatty acid hydroxylase superfamily)